MEKIAGTFLLTELEQLEELLCQALILSHADIDL
jgi:hypothetical protein